jgi:hypothetical protein
MPLAIILSVSATVLVLERWMFKLNHKSVIPAKREPRAESDQVGSKRHSILRRHVPLEHPRVPTGEGIADTLRIQSPLPRDSGGEG